MTKFTDGPAKGQTLMLRRAPVFLRVVEKAGKFDALDQLDDTPKTDEKLTAYTLSERPTRAFIDGTNCNGMYSCGTYKMVENQPDEATLRNTDSWAKWCDENGPKHPLIIENELNRGT